jgi:outer membrane protein with beta-barrel domain
MKSGMNNITSNMHSFRHSIRPFVWIKKRQRSLVLSIVLLALTASGAYAQIFQSVHYGLKGSLDADKISGRSFTGKMNAGYSLGGFAELNFNNQWGIQPEVLFSQANSQTTDDFNGIYGGVSGSSVQMNYINVPVLFFFKPVPELSILLGPQYGYLISVTSDLLPPGGMLASQNPFEKSNLSAVFGAQLNLGKVKVGARYSWGVISLNNLNNSDNWKTQGFQLSFGYRIW